MNTFQNRYDSLEQLIFEEGWSIENVGISKNLDLMLIMINTKAILQQKISSYKKLINATEEELKQFELIANGKGVHWPLLDEDLSLKGFLVQEIKNVVDLTGKRNKHSEGSFIERHVIDRPATEDDLNL